MGVVTRLLEFFRFQASTSARIGFLDSGLPLIMRLISSATLTRTWFSIREAEEFTSRELAARACNEFQIRRLVAR